VKPASQSDSSKKASRTTVAVPHSFGKRLLAEFGLPYERVMSIKEFADVKKLIPQDKWALADQLKADIDDDRRKATAAAAKTRARDRVMKDNYPKMQDTFLRLLQAGTVDFADIAHFLDVDDARQYVADMRHKGVAVEWIDPEDEDDGSVQSGELDEEDDEE